MVPKYVSLEEAAQMLGKSTDELVEMRSRGDIFGYRDGASWKFKVDEIHRVAEEFGLQLHGDSAPLESAGSSSMDDEESVLITDGPSKDSDSSSTIIGRKDQLLDDSDVKLSDLDLGKPGSDDLVLATEGSDVEIADDADLKLRPQGDTGSDVGSDAGSDDQLVLSTESSDVHLVADEDSELHQVVEGASGELPDLGADSDSSLELSASSGTGEIDSDGSNVEIGSGGSGLALGSDLELDSELALSDDDDLVLGDADESDITLGGSDTGINLTQPSDSGLSLEGDDNDIASSISSLELPEDVVAFDDMNADPDIATQLKQDDNFLLSPAGEAADDLEDSGSQVIAIEDSADFAEQAGLANAAVGTLVEDIGYQPAAVQAGEGEAVNFDGWDIGLLSISLMVMILGGILMADVIRNMWSWDGVSQTGSSLMEGIMSAAKLNQ